MRRRVCLRHGTRVQARAYGEVDPLGNTIQSKFLRALTASTGVMSICIKGEACKETLQTPGSYSVPRHHYPSHWLTLPSIMSIARSPTAKKMKYGTFVIFCLSKPFMLTSRSPPRKLWPQNL